MERLSRFAVCLCFAQILLLGATQGRRSKRDINTHVKCYENGRFYRNPDRREDNELTVEECSKYYLCLEGDVFEFRCSQGLLFDVNKQRCDFAKDVHNCDLTAEALAPAPLLTNAPCANGTHLGCSDGECLPAEYFCDGSIDCMDSSDESWCDVNYDPNAALPCDPALCQLPECFCSNNGTEIPGHLVPSQTPQMVTLTFNGPINHENWDIYTRQLLTPERRNRNGCPIPATFFVSHEYTNYKHVQELWKNGHEIAVNSITLRGPAEWWTKNATIEDWFDEMVGQANIINRFGEVRMEDFRGLRVPHYSVGWNRQFLMMQEFGFVYDATVVAPLEDPPFWPYTLDYKMPHKCYDNNQYCPIRSYAGLWEMVINPLKYEGVQGHSCATLDHCPDLGAKEIYDILMNNFKRHYLKNRAPFGIHLDGTRLKKYEYLFAVKRFIDELLKLSDVYFVTYRELIDWIQRPTPVLQLQRFQPWQCGKRNFEECELACTKPRTCKLPSKVLKQDRYMITCNECPKSYPWLRNEFGLDV